MQSSTEGDPRMAKGSVARPRLDGKAKDRRHAQALALTDWDYFVLRHQKRGNIVVHFVSACCYFGGPVVALATWNAWFLGLFFVSGVIGAAGHYVFADGGINVHEATIQRAVPLYVLRMFWKIAKGTYRRDVDAAVAKLAMAR